MKKLAEKIGFLALIATAFISCSKSEIATTEATTNKGEIVASFNEVATKMAPSYGYESATFEWEDGDSFTIFDGTGANKGNFTYSSTSGAFSYSGTEQLVQADDYKAVYPFVEEGVTFSEAISSNKNTTFDQDDAIAGLKGGYIMSVEAFSYNPETSNSATFEHEKAMIIVTSDITASAVKLTLDGSDYNLTVSSSTATNYYFLVDPVVATSSTISVDFGNDQTFTKTIEVAIEKGGLYTLNTIDGTKYSNIWTGTPEEITVGSGTATNPYKIFTPNQLAYLSTMITNKTDKAGVYYKVVPTTKTPEYPNGLFDFNNLEWTPITASFDGMIDFSNCTIINFVCNTTGEGVDAGLFSQISNNKTTTATYQIITTIKNLNIYKAKINSELGRAAAIATYNKYNWHALIENCHVSESEITSGGIYAGGIMAESARGARIIDCTVSNSTITATGESSYSGGITGQLTGSASDVYENLSSNPTMCDYTVIKDCIVNSNTITGVKGANAITNKKNSGSEIDNCTTDGQNTLNGAAE